MSLVVVVVVRRLHRRRELWNAVKCMACVCDSLVHAASAQLYAWFVSTRVNALNSFTGKQIQK